MEDVTDGVWLFGKDSFEECPRKTMGKLDALSQRSDHGSGMDDN